jgi:uncharacterized FAD-dependent dehydrogenase
LNWDVIIIGAGPAGLFAAYELSNETSLKIALVDKGRDILERKCPSAQNFTRCMKCKPCNILCGLGGAGGLSDGKLNLRPDVGGNLEEFVSKGEADNLISKIDRIFLAHGVPYKLYGRNSEDLEKKAASHGIEYIPIPQRHIGSDRLPDVITSIKNDLLDRNVKFFLNTEIKDISINKNFILNSKDDKRIESKKLIVAPGRSGADWFSSVAQKNKLKTRFAPIDIGVRVEVPAVVMDSIIEKSWDPKFHINTKTYDDFLRTFCTCPNGFVVMEDYGEYIGVNGHSSNKDKSNNTNFAFLTKVELTEPVENTTEYGISIAKLATTIGGKMPIIQRLEDLKNGRRSTESRIQKSYVKPTMKNATPGDISMAMPHRIVTNVIEGLEQLDKVIPGVNSDSTLIYAPEIKFYSMRFIVNKNLETNIPNLYVAGDGAGLSRGIVASAATGLIAAKSIINKT